MLPRHLFRPPPESQRYLDGLRALAILMVLGFHTMIQMPEVTVEVRDGLLGRVLLRGGMGVDLFFVLSGYLIGGQLIREGLRRGRLDLGTFYIKRFFRIFPAYYLVLTLICLWLIRLPLYEFFLAGQEPSDVLRGAWANYLYLNNYTGSRVMPWSWSLAVEEHFYLVAPLLLLVLLRFGKHGTRLGVLWALFFLPWVARFAAFRMLGIDALATGGSAEAQAGLLADALAWTDAVFVPTHCRIDSIVIGVLCAYLQQTSARTGERWRGWGGLAWTGVAVLVLAFYLLGKGGKPIGAGASAILFGPVALAFGGILQHCLYRERSPLRAALSFGGFYPIARVSYGMYLLHPFLFAAVHDTGPMLALRGLPNPTLATLAVLAVHGLLAYAAALLMFTLWEWPFMALRGRLLRWREARRGGAGEVSDGPA